MLSLHVSCPKSSNIRASPAAPGHNPRAVPRLTDLNAMAGSKIAAFVVLVLSLALRVHPAAAQGTHGAFLLHLWQTQVAAHTLHDCALMPALHTANHSDAFAAF